MPKKKNRYDALIERVFFKHFKEGKTAFEFMREELEASAAELNVTSVKNIGDITYTYRYRAKLPDSILKTQTQGREWVLEGAGKGSYRFILAKKARIEPNADLGTIEIPDATPELIRTYTLNDEQALLTIIRYNRLVDIFLGLTTYSLQNHLRTSIEDLGQIEIDELYIGIDRSGDHYVIPVQAKGGKDKIGVVQIKQDLSFAKQRFPELGCRPVAVQFLDDQVVALFELTLEKEEIKVVDEKHYRLVTSD